MHTAFVCSLIGLKLSGQVEYRFSQNSLVYDSRNQLAEYAVRNEFDRVLWLDSDMTFPRDLFEQFHKDLNGGIDVVCGLFTSRKPPIKPIVYQRIDPNGRLGPEAIMMKTIPENQIFQVGGVGFGAVMMNTSVLKSVMKTYGFMFSPILGMGEDLSFSHRCNQLGIKMYCDSRIKCGHVGMIEYSYQDTKTVEVEK